MPRDIKECVELFERLPAEIGLKFLRGAGRKAAETIRAEVAARAPVDTGKLKANIVTRTKRESDEEISIDIGPSKKGFYGIFSEFGTAFQTAHPWMGPATEEKFPQAAQTFADELARRIERHFKK